MALNIIKATDPIPARGLMGVIYAPPGIGKTSLSFTAEKPFLIAFEKGVERSFADGRGDFYFYNFWKEVKEHLKDGTLVGAIKENGYKTIIIDTAGTCIQTQITQFILAQGGRLTTKNQSALSMDGWGVASAEFLLLLNTIVNMGVDVICIAHDKGDGKEQKVELDVQGSAKGIITKNADFIAYLYADGSGQRWIDFNGSEDRTGKNPARFERMAVPTCATDGEYPVFMKKIISHTKAAMFGQTKAQKEAVAKLDIIRDSLTKCKTVEDCEKLIASASELPASIKFAALKLIHEMALAFYNLEGIKTAKKMTEEFADLGSTKDVMNPDMFNFIKNAFVTRYKELGLKWDKNRFVKADGTEEVETAKEETPTNESNESED